jgi:hypothetical protein
MAVSARLLIGVVLAELVDQLIGDQTTARGKGPKPISRFWLLHATSLVRSGKSLSCQLGEHLPNRLSLAPSPFLRGAEYIIGNVQRGAHASDDIASCTRSHFGPSPLRPTFPAGLKGRIKVPDGFNAPLNDETMAVFEGS